MQDGATLYIHLELNIEDWDQANMHELKLELMKLLSITDAVEIDLQMFPGSTVIRVVFRSSDSDESDSRAEELARVFGRRELPQVDSYGLYSYGLHSHGLCSYGLYSYCLHSHGLNSYGLCSYGLYSYSLRTEIGRE